MSNNEEKRARLAAAYGGKPNYAPQGGAQTLHMQAPIRVNVIAPELPSERLAELKRKVEQQLAIVQERLLTLGVIAPTTIMQIEEKNMSDDDDVDPKVTQKFKRELRWGYDKLSRICGSSAIVSYVRDTDNGAGALRGITVVVVGNRQFWLEYDFDDGDWNLYQCSLENIGEKKPINERWHDECWDYIEHAVGKLLGDLWASIDEPNTMELE